MQPRFDAAYEAIDAANARDPNRLVVDGVERAKELVHADAVERWVRHLDPEADELQILAARAHHLRRWATPRTAYPAGRAGYLRWRRDQQQRQAAEVAAIVGSSGYDEEAAERVAAIVAKRGLGRDRSVQVHEDALCLAFLELQLDELADQMGPDRTIDVVAKTIKKMSPAAVAAAAGVALSPEGARLLARAVERP
ncbi:MAG: DUF4202 domain-containing protein [Acidimicrobiales bacterium]|nr:DUF4202 domain-containing protein [Acidimicrobiales bacterium]